MYSAIPQIEVLVDGEITKIIASRLKTKWTNDVIGKPSGWQFYEVVSISPQRTEMPSDWYESDDDAMRWFFDNIAMKNKDYEMLEELVQKWAFHSDTGVINEI